MTDAIVAAQVAGFVIAGTAVSVAAELESVAGSASSAIGDDGSRSCCGIWTDGAISFRLDR